MNYENPQSLHCSLLLPVFLTPSHVCMGTEKVLKMIHQAISTIYYPTQRVGKLNLPPMSMKITQI